MDHHDNKYLVEVLSSDDNEDFSAKESRNTNKRKDISVIFVPDGDYGDEVLFVEPDEYSPKKKQRMAKEKRAKELKSPEQLDSDIAVTYDHKGDDFPHLREHCRSYSFQRVTHKSPSAENTKGNEEYCEKCYCFVCDDLANKCSNWTKECNPHCNAFAKNAFWEKEKKIHKNNVNAEKTEYLPILSCIQRPPENIFNEMKKTEISANHFKESIQQLTSNENVSTLTQRQFLVKVKGFCKAASDMVRSYLILNKQSFAIIVLDAITMALCRINKPAAKTTKFMKDMVKQLELSWIEACVNLKTHREFVEVAKQRIQKCVDSYANKLFSYFAKSLHSKLKGLCTMGDPIVAKCLQGESNDDFMESIEVTNLRLSYLKANSKFTEAINYILGVIIKDKNGLPFNRKWSSYLDTRNILIDLLVKVGKFQEAMAVSLCPLNKPLPNNLQTLSEKQVQKNMARSYHTTAIGTLDFPIFRKLVTGLISDHCYSMYLLNDELLEVVAYVLPALYMCKDSLSSKEAFQFYLKSFSSGSCKDFDYCLAEVGEDVHSSVMNLITKKIKNGKLLKLQDLKPKGCVVKTEVYVVEVIATIAALKNSVLPTMTTLANMKLYWMCTSLMVNTGFQDKIYSKEISMFAENVVPYTGSMHISLRILEK